MLDLIIKNGKCYIDGELKDVDIAVKDKKIHKIGQISEEAKEIIDASDQTVLPGCIDTQTHFREPGSTDTEDLHSGSRAAIAGGITSVFEMPNTNPPTSNKKEFQRKLDLAKNRMYCNYAFYFGATADNSNELADLKNLEGCCGIKLFAGSSTGNLLVSDEKDIDSEEIEGMFNNEEQKLNNDQNVKVDDNKKFVYLDVDYNNNRGRIVINLENKIVPKTVNNFLQLCEKKAYVNSSFHRIINNFMIQGGDFTNFDGTGGVSVYGNKFDDENFILKNKKGAVVMANSGPNSNGSQFFILTNDAPWLDDKHVVFGNVVKGMDLVEFLQTVNTDNNDRPVENIKIIDTGVL
mgnify:CR=1 FL=1